VKWIIEAKGIFFISHYIAISYSKLLKTKMDIRHTGLYKNKIVVLVVFVGISLLLFFPSTGRIFLSDDYCTLNNIVQNHSFLLPSFFRPVGDLTLQWTYEFAGLDPFYFYVINIILHAVNSFLIYLFCRLWFAGDRRVHLISILTGIIFLTYPSHSEAILWAIGRGVSLAAFFSLLAMISFVSNLNSNIKYLLVCTFYFIALGSYESALLLPFVLFVLSGAVSKKRQIVWTLLLLTTLFIHLYLRYIFTGGIWQAYNRIIFARDIIQYLTAFIKIILRLFIPPFNYPFLFTICGIAALAILFLALHRNRKRFETDIMFVRTFALCITGLLVTILVSISFGISTRTSEGDRLMYLPSVFYAMLIALLISTVLKSAKSVVIVTVLILIFQVTFLLINQQNWKRASEYAEKIINGIKDKKVRPVYIINLPSDHNGAYIFRNCLSEALLLYNIDTEGVHVLNVVQSTETDKQKKLIAAEKQGEDIFVWPTTLLRMANGEVVSVDNDSTITVPLPLSSFLYWNKQELVPLSE
jgi:hypothetical protein